MKINDYLTQKGFEIIYDGGYFWRCNYNNKEIVIRKNEGVNNTYTAMVEGKTIVTKALLTTCIDKIINYIKKEEVK